MAPSSAPCKYNVGIAGGLSVAAASAAAAGSANAGLNEARYGLTTPATWEPPEESR